MCTKSVCVIDANEPYDEEEYLRQNANMVFQEFIRHHTDILIDKNINPLIHSHPIKRNSTAIKVESAPDPKSVYYANPAICVVCGNVIPFERRDEFTCSETCRVRDITEDQYNLAPKHCAACSNTIAYSARRNNYCDACLERMDREHYARNPKHCKQCGNVIPYEKRNTTYCSSECAEIGQANSLAEANSKSHQAAVERYLENPRYCKLCGKMLPYERRRDNYCSPDCAHKGQAEALRGRVIKLPVLIDGKTHKQVYMQDYHATHKEQKKIHDARYYQKHKAEIDAKHKAYIEAHRDETAAYHKQYNYDHREKIAARRAELYKQDKLGKAICASCGKEYKVTDKTINLCSDCKREVREMARSKNDYADTRPRQILRELGRLTPELEARGFDVIHHADGDRSNDLSENLVILTRSSHTFLHNTYFRMCYEAKANHQPLPVLAEATRLIISKYNIEHY